MSNELLKAYNTHRFNLLGPPHRRPFTGKSMTHQYVALHWVQLSVVTAALRDSSGSFSKTDIYKAHLSPGLISILVLDANDAGLMQLIKECKLCVKLNLGWERATWFWWLASMNVSLSASQ